MSQYRAQLHSILDIIPPSIKLQPRVSSAIMLNILGGVQEASHQRLVGLTHSVYHDAMDVFLHLYGKSSKPGRKIGHITFTSYVGDREELATMAEPLINEMQKVREERLLANTAQMRPQ